MVSTVIQQFAQSSNRRQEEEANSVLPVSGNMKMGM